jgi:hypothetical protein
VAQPHNGQDFDEGPDDGARELAGRAMRPAAATAAGSMVERRMGTMSALWTYVLLNTLFRDIHEIFRPGFITELTNGELATSNTTLVFAAVALQLPLAMTVLNRIPTFPFASWANIVIALITAASTAGTWPKDPDDLVFAGFQLLGLAAIIVLAWLLRRENSSGKAD